MKLMPLNTVARIIAYISRHETAFGFKPTAVGVHPTHWQGIINEFKASMRYTDNRPVDYKELYITGVRIVVNIYMEKVE